MKALLKSVSIKNELNLEILNSILTNLKEAFVALDYNWRYLYMNKQAEHFLGKKRSELLGKRVFDLYDMFRGSEYHKNYLKAIRTKRPVRFEAYQERLNKWWLVSAYPNPREIAIFFADITERKKLELEIKRNEERLELAQTAGKIGTYEWNLQTNEVIWSKQLKELYGLKESEFHGPKQVAKMTHPEDREKSSKLTRRVIKKKQDLNLEYRIVWKDKSVHWLRARGKVFYEKDGTPLKMIGVVVDVTKEKDSEEIRRYLTNSTKLLSSSLDYQTTLKRVATLAVPKIADWCGVDILMPGGKIRQLAMAHVNPEKVRWAKELRKKTPPDMSKNTGLPRVLKTGKSEFYPLITREVVKASLPIKRAGELIKKLNLTSIMIVPLNVGRKTIGAITFVTAENKKIYTLEDLHVAEQLAQRASLAIENATLYKEAKNSKERLDKLISNVPGVVWETWGKPDLYNQRIDYVSGYVEKMLGYSVKEWISTPNFWFSIVHPEDRERARQEAAEIFASKKSGASRFRLIKKDGNPIWVETQSSVITDKEDKPIGMRGVTMDISQRVELERRKDDFISMASHELKTPITSLKVFSQILKRNFEKGKFIDGSTGKYLNHIEDQLSRLTRLVNELLDISRIQAGKLGLNKQQFDMVELINEVIDSLEGAVTQKVIVEGVENLKIKADRDRIGQVLINLITNAAKFSSKSNRIVVHLRKSQNITIGVQDFGVGISKEFHDQIFHRFYQVAEDSLQSTFPGLGMGLFISSEIVRRHGGKIWVKSEKGKGSTFYFSLPKSSN